MPTFNKPNLPREALPWARDIERALQEVTRNQDIIRSGSLANNSAATSAGLMAQGANLVATQTREALEANDAALKELTDVDLPALSEALEVLNDETLPNLQEELRVLDEVVIPRVDLDISAANQRITTTQTNLGTLNADLVLAKNRLDVMQPKLATTESDVNTLKNTTIPALNNELNAPSTGLKARVTTAEGKVNTLTNTTIPALNNELNAPTTGLKARLAAAEGTLQTARTELTAAQSQLTTLNNTTLPALDATLAGKLSRITQQGQGGARTVIARDVASYSSGSVTVPEAMAIVTNVTPSVMFQVMIKGYTYSATAPEIDVMVNGYHNGAATVTRTTYTNFGTARMGVRFAFTRDTTPRLVIILQTLSAAFSYPTIEVPEVYLSYSGSTIEKIEGWTIVPVAEADIATTYQGVVAATAVRDLDESNSLTQGWRTTGQTTIDGGKITADSVTAAQVKANTLTANEIAAGAITASELAANAVYANSIQTNAVTAGKIATDAVTANTILAGAVTTDKMVANAINGDRITANTLNAAKITSRTITADRIGANQITANEIAVRTITAAEIAAGTITANEILSRTITTDRIATNAITANEVAAKTLTAAEIKASTITATEIAGNTITANEIAVGTITAAELKANTITGDKIAANTIAASNLLIGDFTNYFPDPTFSSPGGYGIWTVVASSAVNGIEKYGTGTQNGSYHPSTRFNVVPGDRFFIQATRTTVAGTLTPATNQLTIYVRWYNTAGTAVGSPTVALHLAANGVNSTLPTAPLTVPAGAYIAEVGFFTQATVSTSVKLRISDIVIRRMVDSTTIENGSITTDKMVANTINGDRITANTLNAAKITSRSITADRIGANQVTANEIAANTITANEIKAGTITANELGANAVTAVKLAADAITGKVITGGEINGTRINSMVFNASEGMSVISTGGLEQHMNIQDYGFDWVSDWTTRVNYDLARITVGTQDSFNRGVMNLQAFDKQNNVNRVVQIGGSFGGVPYDLSTTKARISDLTSHALTVTGTLSLPLTSVQRSALSTDVQNGMFKRVQRGYTSKAGLNMNASAAINNIPLSGFTEPPAIFVQTDRSRINAAPMNVTATSFGILLENWSNGNEPANIQMSWLAIQT